jgi:hypothetical protein
MGVRRDVQKECSVDQLDARVGFMVALRYQVLISPQRQDLVVGVPYVRASQRQKTTDKTDASSISQPSYNGFTRSIESRIKTSVNLGMRVFVWPIVHGGHRGVRQCGAFERMA